MMVRSFVGYAKASNLYPPTKVRKRTPDLAIKLRKPKRPKKGYARKVQDRPPQEELQKLIAEHGYRGTGKLFGVTDNAIRKWLKAG